jgi:hypothetical protein
MTVFKCPGNVRLYIIRSHKLFKNYKIQQKIENLQEMIKAQKEDWDIDTEMHFASINKIDNLITNISLDANC